jgi:pilus assembly protein Flp/PilA
MKKLINFFKDEEGASMVEYGLLVALIALAAITTLTDLGTAISGMFGRAEAPIAAAGVPAAN